MPESPFAVGAGHQGIQTCSHGARTGRIGLILHRPAQMSAEISDPGRALALWNTLAPDQASGKASPIRAIFISGLDGSIAIEGSSNRLQTRMDKQIFKVFRSRARLVLVGASTAMSENYLPAAVMPEVAHLRAEPTPPDTWVISRDLREDEIDFVSSAKETAGPDRGEMNIVVPHSSVTPFSRSYALKKNVRVREIDVGPSEFLGQVISVAREYAAGEIACEGGPRLLQALLRAGLLDELVLSLSPHLSFPSTAHLLPSPDGSGTDSWARDLRVVSAFSSDDGGLYTRWIVDADE